MKKTMLLSKKFVKYGVAMALSASLVLGAATGCAPAANQNPAPSPAVQQPQVDVKAIMEEFSKLIAEKKTPKEAIQFINENIKLVPADKAALMINELERLQKEYMPSLEQKLFDESVQTEMIKLYTSNKDINDVSSYQADELKSLVNETLENGFKVDTAEGMFYPVLDYSAYNNFVQYLTEDMKAYVSIMAVESDKAPAKDAALVIGWDEVFERALRQEKFLKTYVDSSKLPEITNLYNNYLYFVFFGLNNTPLFDYQDSEMNPEAKAAYAKLDLASSNSELMKSLADYMELLKKNDYKLTEEVDKFRNAIVGK